MSDECDFGCLSKGTKIKVGLPKPFEKIPVPDWINLKDSLPAKGVDVFLLSQEKVFQGWWDCCSSQLGDFYDSQNSYIVDNVTHWMPLPNLPELSQ